MIHHGKEPHGAASARLLTAGTGALLAVLCAVVISVSERGERNGRSPLEPAVDDTAAGVAARDLDGADAALDEVDRRTPLKVAAPRAEGSEPLGGSKGKHIAVEALGERDFRARFLAEDLTELERRAPAVLLGDASTAEKVAMLRVLSDRDAPSATELHALVLERLPASAPEEERVRTYASRRLGELAAEDPAAREKLRQLAFGPRAEMQDRALRLRAAERVGATSPPEEIELALAGLICERDGLIRQAFENGLAKNPGRQP